MAVDPHYDFDSEKGSGAPSKGNTTAETNDTLIVTSKLWSLFNKRLFKTTTD